MKPSTLQILVYLERCSRWCTIRNIFTVCPTNTPTKRLSELYKAGMIEKRRSPIDPKYMQYRYKEVR